MKIPAHLQFAFPLHPDYCDVEQPADISKGMLLRDYFATAALQAIIAHPQGKGGMWDEAATDAYKAADAMRKARVE
mgnify:CR=1 FL=1